MICLLDCTRQEIQMNGDLQNLHDHRDQNKSDCFSFHDFACADNTASILLSFDA